MKKIKEISNIVFNDKSDYKSTAKEVFEKNPNNKYQTNILIDRSVNDSKISN